MTTFGKRTRTHLCGHPCDEPANFGRGAAREKRLVAYFARPCLPCALARVAHEATRLTDIHGARLPADAEAANVARWKERIRKLY